MQGRAAKWGVAAAFLFPILLIVRAIIYLFVFRADALPEVFVWLATVMGMLALLALFHSLRGMFGASTASDALRATLPERAALLDEKNALLRAIKDIAYEHDVGKLSDEEFERLDRSYRTRAKEVLRKLDEDLEPYMERAEKQLEDHLRPRGGPMRTAEKPRHKGNKKKKKKERTQGEVKADVKAMLSEMARDHIDQLAQERGLGPLPEDAKVVEVCEHCGAKNELFAKRCSGCDARLTDPVCPKCEAVNARDAKFCNKCATAIPDDAEGLL